jgi:beta-glucosidase
MLVFALALFSSSYIPSDADIDAIIAKLSLAEKVGQMAQLGIDDFVNNDDDTVKLEFANRALKEYKVGSVLNTYNLVSHSRYTWANIINTLSQITLENPSQIPLLYGLDSIHGATFVNDSTLFPQEQGMSATFNLALARLGSQISAYETRAANVAWTFSPVVDLGLDLRWSRIWEDFGEDPYLSGQMGAAMVSGFQGTDPYSIDTQHVAACGKHYLGYGNPVSGKDRTPAVISENYLREYHLPPFKALVDAKVATIMVNSGLINGVPVHSSHFLLTELLKGELGFDGFVVTDWGDIENIYIRDKVARSSKEAVKIAINAGIDMSMIPYDLNFCTYLIELVNEGEVPVSRIDDAVRRILRVKARLGLFQTPTTAPANYPEFGSAAYEQAAYDAASESITLLKNEGNILPLPADASILVTGPNANSIRCLDGGWSYSWQGGSSPIYAARYNTILTAIQDRFKNVAYVEGVAYNNSGKYWEEYEVDIPAAVAAASNVDYVVLAVGENSYTEKPGDLQDLTLSNLQLKLALALVATGKPIILLLNEGRPRIIEKFVDATKAVLQLYLPGNFGGDALADILVGTVNPSGRLPYTYPRYPHSLVNYWHKYSEELTAQPGAYNYESDYSPLWEFGTGLSYSTFTYGDLTLSANKITAADKLTVSVTVTNHGPRTGKETVLLYTSDLYASTAPDVKRLRKFTKIELTMGQAQTVTFELSAEDLSFINTDNKRVTEPGDFKVAIGPLSQTFTLQ